MRLTRDAIRVLLEKKKKGVPPFTSFTKGKEMSFNYFYDHERERELLPNDSRVLHIKQTFNSLVAGHRIHVVA